MQATEMDEEIVKLKQPQVDDIQRSIIKDNKKKSKKNKNKRKQKDGNGATS